MKTIFKLVAIVLSISILISCGNDEDFSQPTTIKVVNLIKGVDHLIVKTGSGSINYATTGAKVAFEDFRNFSIIANSNEPIEIVKESDTINPIYSETLNLEGIHSFYFSGDQNETHVFLIEDTPKKLVDSVVGIRFVNLSKSSGPMDVKLVGESTNVVSQLNFESASDFIEFPTKEADGRLSIEFKDTLGNILFDAVFIVDPLKEEDISVKRNVTLVITEKEFPLGTIYVITRINSY